MNSSMDRMVSCQARTALEAWYLARVDKMPLLCSDICFSSNDLASSPRRMRVSQSRW